MALVRNNQKNSGWGAFNQALYGLLTGGSPGNPYALANDVGKIMGNKIKEAANRNGSGGSGPAWSDPGGSSGARRSGNNPRRRKGKESRQKLSSGDSFRQIGFGPTTGLPSVRVKLTGLMDAATTATGTYSHSNQKMLGYHGSGFFQNLNADAKKLFDAFEKSTVHSVTVKFVGTTASTASGHFVLGMDSSTDASDSLPQNAATGVADKCTHVMICDVKGEGSLSYRPSGTDKECRNKDAIAADSEKWCGKIYWVAAGSNIAASTVYGLLQITVDVTLHQ